jgi:hypothetical protein
VISQERYPNGVSAHVQDIPILNKRTMPFWREAYGAFTEVKIVERKNWRKSIT